MFISTKLPRIELAFQGGILKTFSIYFGPKEFKPIVPNNVKQFDATIKQ